MIRVISFWSGWNDSAHEAELWTYLCRAFDIDDLVMVPETGLEHSGLREMKTIAAAVDEARADGFDIVVLSEDGETLLPDFVHPGKVAYVCGPSGQSMPSLTGEVVRVRIPTPNQKGLLWGHQAAAIVLYDRLG